MENAAKALLIAGGILIAIMTLSLVVYAATATKRIEQAEYEKLQAEKLSKFNMEYEAYNKRRLYGLDVISVINKAIEHNKKMDVSQTSDKYYINIKFITRDEFKNELYKIDNNKGPEDPDSGEKLVSNPDTELGSYSETRWINLKDKANASKTIDTGEHTLGKFQDEGKDFVTNNNFLLMFDGSMEDLEEDDSTNNITYKLYSALTNFKRALFACTTSSNVNPNGILIDETISGVEYDNETGRIKELTFVQLPSKKE